MKYKIQYLNQQGGLTEEVKQVLRDQGYNHLLINNIPDHMDLLAASTWAMEHVDDPEYIITQQGGVLTPEEKEQLNYFLMNQNLFNQVNIDLLIANIPSHYDDVDQAYTWARNHLHEYIITDQLIPNPESDSDFNITINPLNIEVKDSRISTMITNSITVSNRTNTENLEEYKNTNGQNIWKTMKDGIFNGNNAGDRGILLRESYNGVNDLFKYMKNINRKPESLSTSEFDTLKTRFRNIDPPIIGETREENKTLGNYNRLSVAFNLGYFINLLEEGPLRNYNFHVRYTRGDGFCGWRSILSVIRKKNGNENTYDYINDHEFTQEYTEFLKALPNTIKEIINLGLNWEIFNESTFIAETLEYKKEHIKFFLDKFNNPQTLDDMAMILFAYYYNINLHVLKINYGAVRGDHQIDLDTRFQTILGITSFNPIHTSNNILIFHSGSHYTPVISGNNTNEFWTNTEIENIKSILNKPINYYEIIDIITGCNNNI